MRKIDRETLVVVQKFEDKILETFCLKVREKDRLSVSELDGTASGTFTKTEFD
jgi:hypothetical protein